MITDKVVNPTYVWGLVLSLVFIATAVVPLAISYFIWITQKDSVVIEPQWKIRIEESCAHNPILATIG